MNAVTKDRPMTIGLMGQPNTGKSTFFNALTGSRQHVGNWPGKTVERKSGYALIDGRRVSVVDLPGTYSLSANSDEERITRDYICDGEADVIVALVDASQLERSLYLLADFAGIDVPVVVALNMTDVAAAKGITVDAQALSERIGVPVVSTVATRKEGLERLLSAAVSPRGSAAKLRTEELERIYADVFGDAYRRLLALLPDTKEGRHGRSWIAGKLLEGDDRLRERVIRLLSADGRKGVEAILGGVKDGALLAADCKFAWISTMLSGIVRREERGAARRGRFDRAALHPAFGKALSVIAVLAGFVLSMVVAAPVMMGLMVLTPVASSAAGAGLASLGLPAVVVSLVSEALIPSTLMAGMMAAVILGVALVFGILEDVGYMARVSYNFDNLMSKLGLHGKSVMSFVMSLGCNIGGITGSRVIDSWQQRLVTIATSWVIPCGGVWGVTLLMGSLFFGAEAIWVLLLILVLLIAHMKLTSHLFGRVFIKDMDRTGLIMEMPPYHKPNWKTILSFVWVRISTVFTKAFFVIVGVSVGMWLLSYSPSGDVSKSVIYRIGSVIEPFGMLFGLDWKLFTAFIISAMGKEASLGVLAMLYGIGSGASSFTGTMMSSSFAYDNAALSTALLSSVPKASALAFMVAFFFNVPCMAAIAATRIELRSTKWTLLIVAYYLAVALLLGGLAYRVGLAVF